MLFDEDERLTMPYVSSDKHSQEIEAHERLGSHLPSVARLIGEIRADCIATSFGVQWWAGNYPRRQALVTDHLLQSARAIVENIANARVHYLQHDGLRRALDEEYRQRNRAIEGDRIPAHPVGEPRDDFRTRCIAAQKSALFGSLSAALDAFAAVCIGVAAIPSDIVRADYAGLIKFPEKRKSACLPAHKQLIARIASEVSQAGPAGWLEWMDAMRNMLLHRPSRSVFFSVNTHPTGLFSPRGVPMFSATQMERLPRAPGQSDIEALRNHSDYAPVLEESSQTTLNGVFVSIKTLIDAVVPELINLWQRRRSGAEPSLVQPLEQQWPVIRKDAPVFSGYAPGSVPYNPSAFQLSPEMIRRLDTSSMINGGESDWRRALASEPDEFPKK